MRYLTSACLAFLCGLSLVSTIAAQDLLITNARVIDGNGNVIENGAIAVRDGLIAAVSEQAEAPAGALEIDAGGRTVMPGIVDAHRHFITGQPDEWLNEQAADRMWEFVEAGVTTVLSAADPVPQIVQLRDRLAAGEIVGPRLIASGFAPLVSSIAGFVPGVDPARAYITLPPDAPVDPPQAIPHEQIRAAVQGLAAAGVDAVKSVMNPEPGAAEREALAVVVEEAERLGIMSITHAVSVQSTVDAIDAGTHYLVHSPVIGELDEATTRKIAEAGIPMTGTLGVFLPIFADRNAHISARDGDDDNTPRFRDLDPFPMVALARTSQTFANARLLWDGGITMAFGTDTGFLPRDSMHHELIALKVAFSNRDIVDMLTRNAAIAVGLGDTVGTLEAGKIADIVIVDGDPLDDIFAVLDVAMVIKSGEVLIDNR